MLWYVTEYMASETWMTSPDVVMAPIGEELALLDFRSNAYFTLNEVGSTIWSALSEPRTVDEVAAIVAGHFDITQDLCRPDVDEMIENLKSNGLVRCYCNLR